MLRRIGLFGAVLAHLLAAAGAAGAEEVDHPRSYPVCMAAARTDPEKAFDAAQQWLNVGGGDAARHCEAVALMGMKRYAQAADRFENLAQSTHVEPDTKGTLLGQAGQAWLLAGNAERARSVLNKALMLDPDDVDLYVDYSQALAALGNYAGAAAELDKALVRDPLNADALVFRASARRLLEETALAREDVERALNLDPGHLEGLLERGILRRLAGDAAGARQDWMWIIHLAPNSEAAESARANLERLDVKSR